MRHVFAPVSSPTLRSQIAEQLREAILHGRLRAGDKIVERKLASEFGASLTAIREAVITLETEGFITKRPNAATYITELTRSDVQQIFEVRRLLEPHAAARAAERADKEAVEKLKKIHAGMLTSAKSKHLKTYVERDFAFHSTLWQLAGNEFLQSALNRLTLRLFSFSVIRFSADKSFDMVADAESHSALIKLIETRQSDAVSAAMLQALGEWEAEIEAFLDGNGTGAPARPHF